MSLSDGKLFFIMDAGYYEEEVFYLMGDLDLEIVGTECLLWFLLPYIILWLIYDELERMGIESFSLEYIFAFL